MMLLASSALLAPYLQILAGYPVATAGLRHGAARHRHHGRRCCSPAGCRRWIDQRIIMAFGLLVLGWSLLRHERLDAGHHASGR